MYVVVFTAKIADLDQEYSETASKMRKLAIEQYGCTGFTAVLEGQTEVALSYWSDLESIRQWKQDVEHLNAQSIGQDKWYQWYRVDVAKVEHSYSVDCSTLEGAND